MNIDKTNKVTEQTAGTEANTENYYNPDFDLMRDYADQLNGDMGDSDSTDRILHEKNS
jgi:hypothetical protein